MSSKSMMPKLAISAFCLALLSACGSDDGPSMLDNDNGRIGFLGQDKSKVKIPPVGKINNTPLIDKFFTTDKVGQQLSPTVVMNDSNHNGEIDSTDRPSFTSPGIVSGILTPDGEGAEIYKDQRDKSEELQTDIANAQKEVNENKAAVEEAKQALAEATSQDDKKAARSKLDQANEALQTSIAEFNKAVDRFNSTGLPIHNAKDGIIFMEDVNGQYYTLQFPRTIDINHLPNNYPDAGVVRIDKLRTRNPDGSPVDTPNLGSTGREFNKVILFGKDKSKYNKIDDKNLIASIDRKAYLDAYFRSPAAAGWSYQTFGNFHSNTLANRRGLSVGFQSIGQPTPTDDLPKDGYAIYNGIAHAYYNSDQVTMHNEIKANFSKRHLTYKTTDNAMYHTFEGPGGAGTEGQIHVVEYRPDLNLAGEASWDKGVSQFKGNIQAANGLEGKIEGRFYGPKAAEIGGVFGLQGTVKNQVIQYVGGFGAARD